MTARRVAGLSQLGGIAGLLLLQVCTPGEKGMGRVSGTDPATAVAGAPPDADAFLEVSAELGLDFRHVNGMSGRYYFPEMMGAGVAFLDYDADGDLDVFLPQGHALILEGEAAVPPLLEPAHGPGGGRLYRNDLERRPDGLPRPRFRDVTEASGIRADGYGMGVATGDIDGDGQVDLYLANFGANQLWRNRGDGRFEDLSSSSGTDDPAWSTGAVFVDYDRDGRQDLFVINYLDYALERDYACHDASSGRRDYCGPHAYPAAPDRLLHNQGGGRFEDRTIETGVAASFGPALGLAVGDPNRDGWMDILVANDGAPNQLWMNQAGEAFRDEALPRGLGVNGKGVPEGDMGVLWSDLDAGQPAEAAPLIRDALAADPSEFMAYALAGRLAAAEEALRTAIQIDPGEGEANAALARLYRRGGRWKESAERYAAILDRDPRQRMSHVELAMCRVRAGQSREAVDGLRLARRLFPDDRDITNALARLLAAAPAPEARRPVEARSLAEATLERHRSTDSLETMAMVEAAQGDFPAALRLQQEAIAQASRAGQRAWQAALEANLERYEAGEPAPEPWPDFIYRR